MHQGGAALDDFAPAALVVVALVAVAFPVAEGAVDEVLVVEWVTLNAPSVSSSVAVPFWYASLFESRAADMAFHPFCFING